MKKTIVVFLSGVLIGGAAMYFYMQDKSYKVAVRALQSGMDLRREIKTETTQDWESLHYDQADSIRRIAIYDSLVNLALSDED